MASSPEAVTGLQDAVFLQVQTSLNDAFTEFNRMFVTCQQSISQQQPSGKIPQCLQVGVQEQYQQKLLGSLGNITEHLEDLQTDAQNLVAMCRPLFASPLVHAASIDEAHDRAMRKLQLLRRWIDVYIALSSLLQFACETQAAQTGEFTGIVSGDVLYSTVNSIADAVNTLQRLCTRCATQANKATQKATVPAVNSR